MSSSYDSMTDSLSPNLSIYPESLSGFVGIPVVHPPQPPIGQPVVLGRKRSHPIEYEVAGDEVKRRRQDQAFRNLLRAALMPDDVLYDLSIMSGRSPSSQETPEQIALRSFMGPYYSPSDDSRLPPPQLTLDPASAKDNMKSGRYRLEFDVSDSYNAVYNVPLAWTSQGHLFYPIDDRIFRFSPNGELDEFIRNVDATAMATGYFGPNRVECVVCVSCETEKLSVRDALTGTRLYQRDCKRSKKGSYTAVCWHGGYLSVGHDSGALHHFDVTGRKVTGLLGKKAMKTKGVHEDPITRIAWSSDGKFFASGDIRGNVAVWTAAGTLIGVVLKPILHPSVEREEVDHAVTALAWSPINPSLLATGDAHGVTHFFYVTASGVNEHPCGCIKGHAIVTNIHFSRRMPEFIIVYGEPSVSSGDNVKVNTMSAHHLKNLQHLNDVSMYREPCRDWYEDGEEEPPIEGSVVSPDETRIVVAVPGKGELHVWQAWGATETW